MRPLLLGIAIACLAVFAAPAHAVTGRVYGEPDPKACLYYREFALHSYREAHHALVLVRNHPAPVGPAVSGRIQELLGAVHHEWPEYELGSLSCRSLVAPPDA